MRKQISIQFEKHGFRNVHKLTAPIINSEHEIWSRFGIDEVVAWEEDKQERAEIFEVALNDFAAKSRSDTLWHIDQFTTGLLAASRDAFKDGHLFITAAIIFEEDKTTRWFWVDDSATIEDVRAFFDGFDDVTSAWKDKFVDQFWQL